MPRLQPHVALVLGTTIAIAGCTSPGATESPPSQPATPVATGYYRADTTGARAIVDSAGPDLHTGDLVLRADGTYTLGMVQVDVPSTILRIGPGFSSGTWTQQGTRVTLTPTAGEPVVPWKVGVSKAVVIRGDSLAFGTPGVAGVAHIDTTVHVTGSGWFRAAQPSGNAVAPGQYVLRVVNARTADSAGFLVYKDPAGTAAYTATARIAYDTLSFTDGVFVRESWGGDTYAPEQTIAESIAGAYDATAATVVLRWYQTPDAPTSVGNRTQSDSLAVHGDTLIRRSRSARRPEFGVVDQRYVRVR